jgi:hypothetical protein
MDTSRVENLRPDRLVEKRAMSLLSRICCDCGHQFDSGDNQAQRCFICERLAELTTPSPVSSRVPPRIRRTDHVSVDGA